MEMVEDVVIVGAGIAGLATAVALKRVGVRALVLERSEGLRATGAALTLFPNAWLALDALGVSHKLTSVYNPFKSLGYATNVGNGTIQEVSFGATDGDESGPRSVHRKALLEALVEELSIDTIRFCSKLTYIEADRQQGMPIAIVHLEDGTIIKAKVLIGCEGVHSVVANWLGLGAPVDSGRSAVRGLAIYPKSHGLKPGFQQFVDVGKRGGFVPLNDRELYWFFICNSTPKWKDNTGNPELIQRELIENILKDFPPIYSDVIEHSDLSTLTWAPLMFRHPWDIILKNLSKGTITVAGDALHPMTPDLGQGGCSSLEDAVILGRHIGEVFIRHGRLVPQEAAEAVARYVKERRWRVAGLITGSYLSGWVQDNGSGWWMKFFRDAIFYKLLYPRIMGAVSYDCGKLPKPSSHTELEGQSLKI
ncbi:monooxygenase 2-like [Cornus florida]|uniref:monooxygenase 2-like n=1 Tax=Cornus florida TaxID=4283 RepID=UPI002899850D|nr:monooxygenase 2-like [Cornus florida]